MRTRASKKRIISRTFEQGTFLSETDDEPAGCPTGSPLRTGSPTRGVRDPAPATACTLPRPPRPSADIRDYRRIRRPRLEGRGGASGTWKRGTPRNRGVSWCGSFQTSGRSVDACRTRAIPPNPRAARAMRSRHDRAESALVRPSPVRARVPRSACPRHRRGLFTSEKERPKESAQKR